MATRINIRGVIVGSEYDTDWAADYIERGLITPESKFRKALADANGDAVEIYVSSPGGDVMAGGEIVNAIHEYQGEKTIIIGAWAASMAANIVLTAGCPVHAHRNSILLYHGAWSAVVGGSGAMEDEAHILDLINTPIMEALEAHGVPHATVQRGFSEGRAYTMSAREALSYGIVDAILDEVAEAPAPMDDDTVAALEEHSATLPIAAAATWSDDLAEQADARAAMYDLQDQLAAAAEKSSQQLAELQQCAERLHAVEAERDNLAATLAEARSATAAETARANALAADLERATAAHAALVGRVVAPSDDAPTSWRDAVARLGAEQALKLYPALARSYRESKSTKPNH